MTTEQEREQAEREHCETAAHETVYEGQATVADVADRIYEERAHAVEAYKRSIQVEPTADERAHCERVAYGYIPVPLRTWLAALDTCDEDVQLVAGQLRDLLLRERAAVRAESEARIRELEAAQLEAADAYEHEITDLRRRLSTDVAAAQEQGYAQGLADGRSGK